MLMGCHLGVPGCLLQARSNVKPSVALPRLRLRLIVRVMAIVMIVMVIALGISDSFNSFGKHGGERADCEGMSVWGSRLGRSAPGSCRNTKLKNSEP